MDISLLSICHCYCDRRVIGIGMIVIVIFDSVVDIYDVVVVVDVVMIEHSEILYRQASWAYRLRGFDCLFKCSSLPETP